MSWMAFVASLVQSLAWPIGAVALGVVFRRPIGFAFSRGLRRLRIGPIDAEFDQQIAEVRQELQQENRRDPEPPTVKIPDLGAPLTTSNLNRLVEASAEAAVTSAYGQVEARLVELLDEAGIPSYTAAGGPALARLARRHDLISDETLSAVEGLSVMRNLAVHSGGEVSRQRAREYLALADGVLYALRRKSGS